MKKLALHWQVIIGMILGLIVAYLAIKLNGLRIAPVPGEVGGLPANQFILDYINPFGDIFINVLKLLAVPMVLFSIISGVASLKDLNKLGRMGIKTLLTYVGTTLTAVIIGLVLVNIFQPGKNVEGELLQDNRIRYELWQQESKAEKLDDICLICEPENAGRVAAIKAEMANEQPGEWVQDKLNKRESSAKKGPLSALVEIVPKNIVKAVSNNDMLAIIFFAIFFGIVALRLEEHHKGPLFNMVDALNEVFVKMVWVVMNVMPFFVFALMAGQIVKAAGADPNKLSELLSFLLQYSLVVVAGLLFMIFVFYPGLIGIFVKKIGFKKFMKGMRDAQITAFSTSSSVATLPVTMKCVDEKLEVPEKTWSFVLPIGATVNMDGTSLYQAVAVVAMAQFHMVDLTLGQQAMICLTATLASIGAAAIPSAGLVLMIVVLESVGLNPAWIALIFPVDRILDMCRTVVNVTGDGAVSSLIANSEGELTS
ncbi:MAG: dicarboxylate/amino acid:cation symporter [Flavobacteriales bacterium]|nr:dicarboxylate/amino acid:cation symporter [Flavobacteriales bacterium]